LEHFDQILRESSLATDEQINDARERGRRVGGTLDEQLYRLGYVGKTDLIAALARRHDCPGIDPSDLNIPDHVRQRIPADLARRLGVLPIGYDPAENVLTVLVARPGDPDLRHELETALSEYRLEYSVTLGSLLECKLIEVYRNDASSDDSATGALSDVVPHGNFLMVTAYPEADQYLAMALSAENNRVVIVDTEEEAASEIDSDTFSAILIRDTDVSRYRSLVDRCRMLSLSTPVRFYNSLASLTGTDVSVDGGTSLLAANMRLCISLLSSEEDLSAGRLAPMGHYVERICRQLRLPSRDRLLVTNAAYLYDLARLYLGDTETPDWQSAFAQQETGGSLSFPPIVTDILHQMNQDEPVHYPDRLPLEALGGIILKLVDYYLRRWPGSDKISIKLFDAVRQHLRDRSGRLFPEQVVEAFLVVLHLDAAGGSPGPACDVLLYAADGRDTLLLEPCFKNLGFEVILAASLDEFVQVYETAWPDFLVLQAPGAAEDASDLLSAVIARGVMVDRVPTFLLAESPHVNDLHYLLQSGLEDVLPLDGDLDPLLVKMSRIRSRREIEQRDRLSLIQNVGTHGTLEDMNAIDLFQAMGHSQKTVRISVTGNGRQLTVYFEQGALMNAVGDEDAGAEAVYSALGWRTGVWSVDPIEPDDLPEPNIFESIDSILIEGCRRLDEGNCSDPDQPQDTSFFDSEDPDSLF